MFFFSIKTKYICSTNKEIYFAFIRYIFFTSLLRSAGVGVGEREEEVFDEGTEGGGGGQPRHGEGGVGGAPGRGHGHQERDWGHIFR